MSAIGKNFEYFLIDIITGERNITVYSVPYHYHVDRSDTRIYINVKEFQT